MYYFGSTAASDDTRLLDYFHTTQQANDIFIEKSENKNFIYVTRSGCGKSALVEWLRSKKVKRNKLYLSSSEFSLVCEDNSLSIDNYKNIILAELFIGIIDEFKGKLPEGKLKDRCNEFTKNGWFKKVKDFFATKFTGINILGNGFTLNASERRQYLEFIKKTKKISKASELLIELGSKLNILIIVDNLENLVIKGMNEVDDDNRNRIGAFLSALNNLSEKNIQVAAFTKEYILQAVKEVYIDFSHYNDKITGLEWHMDDLVQLLDNRIVKRIDSEWEEIISISKKSFKDNILTNLINGPRDLIKVSNEAGKIGKKITKKMYDNELVLLCDSHWEEIEKQYKTQKPHISTFAKTIIEILVESKRTELTKEEFKAILLEQFGKANSELSVLRKNADWINTAKWHISEIIEFLFLIGVLGYKDSSNHKIFTWQGRSVYEFSKAQKIFVSPLFAKYI